MIIQTPEQLRLLRLRALLDSVNDELEEAVVETTISDNWANAVLTAQVDVNRARAIVLSSLQAYRFDPTSVVK